MNTGAGIGAVVGVFGGVGRTRVGWDEKFLGGS